MKFQPLCPMLGAKVEDIDVRELGPGEHQKIRDALNKYLLLVFPGQDLSVEEHMGFTEIFGEMAYTPQRLFGGDHVWPKYPYVDKVSNIEEDGEPIGTLGNWDLAWHSDMSTISRPWGTTVLYAVEVPEGHGNTVWANMYAALESLPVELRQKIEGHQATQDGFLYKDGDLDVERTRADDLDEGDYDGAGATHPETGRKILFLGRRAKCRVDGMEPVESDELLDELWRHAVAPGLAWTHEWRAGDLLAWDNRATIHRRDEFDNGLRRRLHRTATKGERPY